MCAGLSFVQWVLPFYVKISLTYLQNASSVSTILAIIWSFLHVMLDKRKRCVRICKRKKYDKTGRKPLLFHCRYDSCQKLIQKGMHLQLGVPLRSPAPSAGEKRKKKQNTFTAVDLCFSFLWLYIKTKLTTVGNNNSLKSELFGALYRIAHKVPQPSKPFYTSFAWYFACIQWSLSTYLVCLFHSCKVYMYSCHSNAKAILVTKDVQKQASCK